MDSQSGEPAPDWSILQTIDKQAVKTIDGWYGFMRSKTGSYLWGTFPAVVPRRCASWNAGVVVCLGYMGLVFESKACCCRISALGRSTSSRALCLDWEWRIAKAPVRRHLWKERYRGVGIEIHIPRPPPPPPHLKSQASDKPQKCVHLGLRKD